VVLSNEAQAISIYCSYDRTTDVIQPCLRKVVCVFVPMRHSRDQLNPGFLSIPLHLNFHQYTKTTTVVLLLSTTVVLLLSTTVVLRSMRCKLYTVVMYCSTVVRSSLYYKNPNKIFEGFRYRVSSSIFNSKK
jgi:hypothetical protein